MYRTATEQAMRTRRRDAVLAVAAALVGLTAPAGDWPQFRGPNRDGAAPGAKLPEVWPKELRVRWRAPLGEGFSSPAVAAGKVFVISGEGNEEVARCLEAGSGRELWRRAYAARYRSSWGGGPRVTPTVDGDRVYTIGGTGEMHCLSTANGAPAWRIAFKEAFHFRVPTYGCASSPLVDGDRLLVHVGGTRGDSVVALDKRTGKVIWKALDDPPGYASPILVPASKVTGPRQLVVFSESGLASVDPGSGALFWRYPWTTSYEQNIATPILQGRLLLVTSLSGTAVLRLGVADGKPVVAELWRRPTPITHFSCPVADNGFLYLPHGRRTDLRCIAIADGRECWRADLPGRQRAGMVLADAKLLIYTDRGRLLVADASPDGFRKRAEYALAGRNWVPPILANGCLFLRDEGSLQCVELGPADTQGTPGPGRD